MIPDNDETRFILGMPNFQCASYAHMFRRAGHEVPEKAEHEQAFVIRWLLNLYIEHGSNWRYFAVKDSKVARDEIQRRDGVVKDAIGRMIENDFNPADFTESQLVDDLMTYDSDIEKFDRTQVTLAIRELRKAEAE